MRDKYSDVVKTADVHKIMKDFTLPILTELSTLRARDNKTRSNVSILETKMAKT